MCEWEVLGESLMGSDHFPIVTRLNLRVGEQGGSSVGGRWKFEEANWELFRRECDARIGQIDDSMSVDGINSIVVGGIVGQQRRLFVEARGVGKGR